MALVLVHRSLVPYETIANGCRCDGNPWSNGRLIARDSASRNRNGTNANKTCCIVFWLRRWPEQECEADFNEAAGSYFYEQQDGAPETRRWVPNMST